VIDINQQSGKKKGNGGRTSNGEHLLQQMKSRKWGNRGTADEVSHKKKEKKNGTHDKGVKVWKLQAGGQQSRRGGVKGFSADAG